MIRMKALRQFRGRPSEGRNGMVKPGREFTVSDKRRADDLERGGLAVLAPAVAPATPVEATAPTQAANAAADLGPLSSAGGETGETDLDASSSPADLAHQDATSDQSGDDAASSPSTRAGGSRRGRTSYTRATGTGGGTGKGSRRSRD